jgi:hypothetical protein
VLYSITKNDDRITLLELFQLLEIYSVYKEKSLSLSISSNTTGFFLDNSVSFCRLNSLTVRDIVHGNDSLGLVELSSIDKV